MATTTPSWRPGGIIPTGAPPPGTAPKPLPAPRWTGSTAMALSQALTAAAAGCALILEDHAGLTPEVFSGPRGVVEVLPGDPWLAWGLAFILPALVVLALSGSPRCRYALGALAAVLFGFAIPALLVGFERPGASLWGGLVAFGYAVGIWQNALALGRRSPVRR